LQSALQGGIEAFAMARSDEFPGILPLDEHDRALVANVHPPAWRNPEPAPRYNLVVVGGGTAGLVSAAGAAGLGAKVALVERHLLGGDCLVTGCVPSKAVIRSSRVIGELRSADGLGVHGSGTADFAAVMDRMRRLRARISPSDSAARFRELGVDVFLGHARFTAPDAVTVDGKVLRFSRAVIATGARAAALPIPGLEETGYLTNETVFTLTTRPPALAVIGGGPIGCELAQAFTRLGSEVVVLSDVPQLLPRDDPDAARIVKDALERDGVRLVLDCEVRRVTASSGRKLVEFAIGGAEDRVTVDAILVAAGRTPNVEGMGLDIAGVTVDRQRGVVVDDHLRTANPRIFAAGDVCMSYKFTHAADFAARTVIQNALFRGRKKLSALTMPWCTYTDPEVAHVGLGVGEAAERGVAIDTFTQPLSDVDRAILDGEEDGFVRVHVRRGTDRIVGATIVARHAGEMIGEITLAMAGGMGLKTIAAVIHPYPTQAEAIRKLGDAYNRTRLTPFVKKLFATWLSWTR
jgi:pyruvate/2-oxoglutarate dehydrogenase complex dihydrolipoamide dehydrogenase (E3) component